jgi:simple sugar transport system ATP-binding protein
MVHQHFMLVPTLSVVENVVLGTYRSGTVRLSLNAAAERVAAMSRAYGLELDPWSPVQALPLGQQQRVEIVKALCQEASVLILDEPTTVLAGPETDELFAILRRFADNGGSVLFISHKLNEVLALSHRVVVLRHGAVVGDLSTGDVDRQALVRTMVGRDHVTSVSRADRPSGRAARLELRGVATQRDHHRLALAEVDASIRAGEIVGIAGVDGNGQTELAEVITGLIAPAAGEVLLDGQVITHSSVRERWDRGLRYVPEDRHATGLVLDFNLGENAALREYHDPPFTRHGWMSRAAMTRFGERLAEEYDVRAGSLHAPVRRLSGGNQQKIVLARETHGSFGCLVAAQPTRGLDAVTSDFVLKRLLELRDEGVAVLFISSDLDELLLIADRVAVLYEGQLVGPVDRDAVDRDGLGMAMATGILSIEAPTHEDNQ